jgi:hypothetical protein
MGVVTSILNALRRIGTPTQRSALRRLDESLEGKEVLGYERLRVRDASGLTDVFVATTLPIEEVVAVLNPDEVLPLKENALYGLEFLGAFGIDKGTGWTLHDLDQAFAAWQVGSDKSVYTDQYVIEVLGAMFGDYCASRLNMRWIKLTDRDGSTLAIEGIAKVFRGFPYQTISKRIHDSEHGFFIPVFNMLQHNSREADDRADAT